MSWRLQKDREFTAEEERELFKTSSLTVRKQHASTQSESETSTKRPTRRFNNNKESPFDTSTESSNTITMNPFQQEQDESSGSQEDLRSQESQEDSRSKSSSSNMISQQQFEFQMMKMKLKMMRLEAQKLKHQKELTERDISFQSSTSNKSSTSVYW